MVNLLRTHFVSHNIFFNYCLWWVVLEEFKFTSLLQLCKLQWWTQEKVSSYIYELDKNYSFCLNLTLMFAIFLYLKLFIILDYH